MFSTTDELFMQTVEQAKQSTHGDSRWCNAIDRAVQMLDGNPYVHLAGDELLVMSDTSLQTYAANGSCQCAAYARGFPCKHRAAKRLLQRYYEAKERLEQATDADGQMERTVTFDEPWPHLPQAAPALPQTTQHNYCTCCGVTFSSRAKWLDHKLGFDRKPSRHFMAA